MNHWLFLADFEILAKELDAKYGGQVYRRSQLPALTDAIKAFCEKKGFKHLFQYVQMQTEFDGVTNEFKVVKFYQSRFPFII